MQQVEIDKRRNSVTIFVDGVGVGGYVGCEEVIAHVAQTITPQQPELRVVVDNSKKVTQQ